MAYRSKQKETQAGEMTDSKVSDCWRGIDTASKDLMAYRSKKEKKAGEMTDSKVRVTDNRGRYTVSKDLVSLDLKRRQRLEKLLTVR